METLLFFFLISITISFLCSIWEAVILSITPSFVSRIQSDKPALGNRLNRIKQDIDKPLSAILTLNTIAHTVGAIGVGIEAGKIFGNHRLDLSIIDITYESLIAGVMTLAILILSEIIPKTLGAFYWKRLTPFTVRSIRFLMVLLAPFVWISNLITQLVKKDGDTSIFSRADVVAMADAGLKSGAIDKEEKSIIQNLLQLETKQVKDIMTPRSVVLSLDEEDTLGEIYKSHNPFQFSRIPVYNDTSDNITGFILKDGILESIAADKHNTKAIDIRRKVLFVDANFSVAQVLDTFILKKQHMAMVADEFGTIVGLVTMEDVIETLFGLEIIDESDKVADLQKLARDRWKKNRSNN